MRGRGRHRTVDASESGGDSRSSESGSRYPPGRMQQLAGRGAVDPMPRGQDLAAMHDETCREEHLAQYLSLASRSPRQHKVIETIKL